MANVVEIPVNWYLDDFPPLAYVGGIQPGQQDTETIHRRWKDIFDYAYERVPNGVYAVAVHPQIIGEAHHMLFFERLVEHISARTGSGSRPVRRSRRRGSTTTTDKAGLAGEDVRGVEPAPADSGWDNTVGNPGSPTAPSLRAGLFFLRLRSRLIALPFRTSLGFVSLPRAEPGSGGIRCDSRARSVPAPAMRSPAPRSQPSREREVEGNRARACLARGGTRGSPAARLRVGTSKRREDGQYSAPAAKCAEVHPRGRRRDGVRLAATAESARRFLAPRRSGGRRCSCFGCTNANPWCNAFTSRSRAA
jgi:hypothetical protein